MHKIVMCIFAVFITAISFADLGQKIEGVNTKVKAIGTQSDLCSGCAGAIRPNPEDLMFACVRSICSPAQASVATELVAATTYAKNPDAYYRLEIQPVVDAIGRLSAEGSVEGWGVFNKWLENPPDLESPSYIRVFNLMNTLAMAGKSEVQFTDGKFIVDQKKSRPKFPEMNDASFGRYVKIHDEILKIYLDHVQSDHYYAKKDHAVNMMLYRDGLHAKARQTISSIFSQSQRLQEDPQLGGMFKIILQERLFSVERLNSLIDEGVEIDTVSLDILNETKILLDVMSIATDPARSKILDSPPINIKKMSEDNKLNEVFLRRRKQAQEFLASPSSKISVSCQVTYGFAQRFLPSEKEVESFRRRMESFKAHFFEQTKDLVCAADQEKYRSQVQSWRPYYALTKERHREFLRMSLQRELQANEKGRDDYKRVLSSEQKDQILASILPLMISKEDKQTKSADDVCDPLFPRLIPDSAALKKEGFVVGPMPIRFPEAEGIVFHELGHHLLQSIEDQKMCFDSKRIAKIRACLSSLHPESSESRKTFYEHEDWSDLISAGQGDFNKACLYNLKTDRKDYVGFSLNQTDSDDTHSSDLFRLLHIHFVKSGDVTPQCREALAARGEKPDFKNCLFAK